jgi:CHAT domain-containing protein
MDLRGTELLVLSACQTGLGEVCGEGVFGLQRGFKKAGVKTILMSLWEVDDIATQLLMAYFYDNLSSGMLKNEALIDAQNRLRNCKEYDFSSPYYWAAFILLDGIN